MKMPTRTAAKIIAVSISHGLPRRHRDRGPEPSDPARRTHLVLAMLALASVLVGCGTDDAASGPTTPPIESTTASPTAAPTKAASPPSAGKQLTTGCVGGTVDLSKQPLSYGSYTACVRVGAHIALTLARPPVGSWQPLSASVPNSVEISDQTANPQGDLAAHLIATRIGRAEVAAETLFAGDRHGPPSEKMTLRLTITQ